MAKNTSVFGILRSREQAERVVDALRLGGFRAEDISVLLPENIGNKELGTEKATKSPEGAAAGGATGAIAGGVLGWLVGIGALAIPGIGPFIAAGPIMAALAGAAVGAAAGGLTGALVGLGIPEYEAKQYEGKILKGNILISVPTENSDEIERAKEIFKREGAQDISYTGESSVKAA